MSTTCEFPFVLNCFVIVYCITLIALFTNFYIETYRHQTRDREAAAAAAALMAGKAKANAAHNGVQHVNGAPVLPAITAKSYANGTKNGAMKNGDAIILNSDSSSQVYQRRH